MLISNKFRAILSAFALVLLVGAALPGTASAADRPLGLVDGQRIMEEYEAARDAYEQYQKFLQELELEVADREKALTALMEEIESQKLLLGQDALATKYQQFEQQKAEYFQFREGIDQRAENEYKAKITPILDQVKTIVERIGKEKGYGLIIDSSTVSVMYKDDDFDLTNDVLAALARGED
jgi:outer membrane protein